MFLLSNYFSAEEYGLFGLIYSTLTVISTFCFAWLGAYFLRFTKVSSHARSIFQLTLVSFAGMLVCLGVIYFSRATWGIYEIAIIGFGAVAVGFFYVARVFGRAAIVPKLLFGFRSPVFVWLLALLVSSCLRAPI